MRQQLKKYSQLKYKAAKRSKKDHKGKGCRKDEVCIKKMYSPSVILLPYIKLKYYHNVAFYEFNTIKVS